MPNPDLANSPAHFVYFDVNKTIIMSDSVANKAEQDVINAILAENVLELFFDWEQKSQAPQSFYHYVNQIGKELFPHDYHARKEYRNHRVHDFLSYLKSEHPALLPKAKEHYDLLKGALSKRKHGSLVWSFSTFVKKILDFWEAHPELNSKLVFRTFGQDLSEIEASLKLCIDEHLDFCHIAFTAEGDLKVGNKTRPRNDFGKVLRYELSSRFIGVSDNYLFWRKRHFATFAAKPMPLFGDKSFCTFFDDNIKGNQDSLEKRDIVFPYRETDKTGVLPREVIGTHLIKVNPYEVLTCDDYFLREYNAACQRAEFVEYSI